MQMRDMDFCLEKHKIMRLGTKNHNSISMIIDYNTLIRRFIGVLVDKALKIHLACTLAIHHYLDRYIVLIVIVSEHQVMRNRSKNTNNSGMHKSKYSVKVKAFILTA